MKKNSLLLSIVLINFRFTRINLSFYLKIIVILIGLFIHDITYASGVSTKSFQIPQKNIRTRFNINIQLQKEILNRNDNDCVIPFNNMEVFSFDNKLNQNNITICNECEQCLGLLSNLWNNYANITYLGLSSTCNDTRCILSSCRGKLQKPFQYGISYFGIKNHEIITDIHYCYTIDLCYTAFNCLYTNHDISMIGLFPV